MPDENPAGSAPVAVEAVAPPGDAAPAAEAPAPEAVASAEAPPAPDLSQAPDFSDPNAVNAWLEASASDINAHADDAPVEAVTEESPPPTTAVATPAAAAQPSAPATAGAPSSEVDEQAALAALAARGYTVQAPAPPPDPYATLTSHLTQFTGTPEEYAQAQQAALVQLPAEPAAYDAETMAAHEQAVNERNQAAARLQQMNQARQITDLSRAWMRQQVLGQEGQALSSVPAKYGLSPELAKRVSEPVSLQDAFDATVEGVTAKVNADWQAKYDAREKHWKGEVARARSDRAADSLRRMGSAPQPGGAPGGRPAPGGLVWGNDVIPGTNLPTEAAIQRAISGGYANVDLSDR